MYIIFVLFSCIFFFHVAFSSSNKIIASSKEENDHKSLSNCIKNICQNAIDNPTVMVLDRGENSNELIEIIQRHNIPCAIFTNEDFIQIIDKSDQNILILIRIKDCKDLTGFNVEYIQKYWKYLIVVSDYDKNCDKNLNTIGQSVDRFDVTFLLPNKTDKNLNQLVTFMPEIEETTCEFSNSSLPIHINTCVYGALEKNLIFPVKNRINYKKCPFKIGVAGMYPFTFLYERFEDLTPIANVKGSDIELMKIVADHLNTTLKMFYIYKTSKNPLLYVDYLKYLINGTLDACTGGFYRAYGDLVEYSGIYNRQAVIWIYTVKREGRSWQTLFAKMNGLYYFGISYIIYSCIWWLMSIFDKDSVKFIDTLLYTYGAMLGCASLPTAKSFKKRLINIAFLYLCIHFSAYISIKFYSFLTIQAPPPMLKSNDDVMNSGRIPYLNNATKNFVQDSKYLEFAAKAEDCTSFEGCAVLTMENDGLTVILDGYFVPFQVNTTKNYEARLLKATENVLTVYHEMLLSRRSFKVKAVEEVVNRLFEAGICDQLFKQAVGLTVVDKSEEATKTIMMNNYGCGEGCAITLSQMAGVWYIWGIGCCVACLIFLMECLRYN